MSEYSIFEKFEKTKTLWSRWVERFEGAMEIVKPEDKKKIHLLLHYMGQEAYDILADKLAPEKPKDKTYSEVIEILTSVFDPAPLEILENYRFHMRKQASDETMEEFSIALRKMAINCNFGQYLNTALRNQFVFGLSSSRIQNRLLETSNLTLENALTTAKAMELSAIGGAEIQQQKEAKQVVDHLQQKMVTSNQNQNSNKTDLSSSWKPKYNKQFACYRCGIQGHRANQCEQKNSVCSFCNLKGHKQSACFKAKKGGNQKVHYINDTSTTDCIEEILNVSTDYEKHAKLGIYLKINNAIVGFEIDSGSPVTIINRDDMQRYFKDEKLQSTNKKLISYCGTEIKVLGCLSVRVDASIDCQELNMYVVESKRGPLLGREWLHSLRLDWNKILGSKGSNQAVSSVKIEQSAMNKVEELKQKYSIVFESSMGKIKNIQARIYLREGAKPMFVKARKAPYALLDSIERELDELEKNGVIQKVDSARWATPIVPVRKQGDKVRLCGDYKITVNPRIIVEEHPLPTIEELFASMAGGEKFTKIDLSKAYLQMEVHPDDREILTLSTHRGLYQPTRLMYGIASGPAKWQREIEQILKDIDGVSVFLDDIKITAPNDEQHLQRLEEVLSRLSRYNMRANLEKCEFMAAEIEYCGYRIDRLGIHKMKTKIDAVRQMPMPTNKDEIRAFIGLVNYYGRFFENLSTILYPLNNLLKDKVEFIWGKDCEKAFQAVKTQIQKEIHLVYYDPKLPLVLATDASPVGVGAVLSHIYPDGSEKPIQFASQTLSSVQQRYTQIDREAYAIIFGIRKFYQYVYARNFILITDNKPLTQILSPEKGLPTLSATRMQHYAIFLQSFDYEIRYRKSADHANADALSRLPVMEKNEKIEEAEIIEINAIETLPLTVKQLEEATLRDEVVSDLINGLKSGKMVKPDKRFNIDQNEFTLQKGCLLRGFRVYVPMVLRKKVLEELHIAHFGITRMKSLARSCCWWPKLDTDIENVSKNCLQCQMTRTNPSKVTTHVWEAAKSPFERVHVDFAGPFMGEYFFILIDAYTKWPEVCIIPNITTAITIEKCREIFARFGIPKVLVSDNGPQFTSDEFQQFMNMNGVLHKLIAPYHPATNGQAERNVQTIKNKLKTMRCNRSEIGKELCKILLNYRRTSHATTGESPSFRMFNRQIRSRLDIMLPTKNERNDNGRTMQKNEIKIREMYVGDRVSVRNYNSDGKYKLGTIIKVLGLLHYIVKLDDGRIWKRHIDQIHRIGLEIQPPKPDTIPYHYDVSENRNIIPEIQRSTNLRDPVRPPAQEEELQQQSTEASRAIETETRMISEQSRPKREIKAKTILTYNKKFEQVANFEVSNIKQGKGAQESQHVKEN